MSKVVPARRRGLGDEVADRVRAAIFDGTYLPGALLREVELAAALEVSRGPVREALFKLEREGLVNTVWHRGTTVTVLSTEDVVELDSLRAVLDQLAVQQVVQRASNEDIAAIEQAAVRMDHATDDHDLVRYDIEFHDAVFAAAHHRRLEQAWQAIRSQVHLFLLTRIGLSSTDYLVKVPYEHHELAEALRARDATRALLLFTEHRKHAFNVVLTGTE